MEKKLNEKRHFYPFSSNESSKGIAPVKRIFLRPSSLSAQLLKHQIACSRTLTFLWHKELYIK